MYDGSEPISQSYILLKKFVRKLSIEAKPLHLRKSSKNSKWNLDRNFKGTTLTLMYFLDSFWSYFWNYFWVNSLLKNELISLETRVNKTC